RNRRFSDAQRDRIGLEKPACHSSSAFAIRIQIRIPELGRCRSESLPALAGAARRTGGGLNFEAETGRGIRRNRKSRDAMANGCQRVAVFGAEVRVPLLYCGMTLLRIEYRALSPMKRSPGPCDRLQPEICWQCATEKRHP